jgi:hypothetical protein
MKYKEKLFNEFVKKISTNPEYFKKSEVDLLEEAFNCAWKKALEFAVEESGQFSSVDEFYGHIIKLI